MPGFSFSRFSRSYPGQIILVLLLFAACRIFTSAVFFDGFLHVFGKLNSWCFGENAPAFLKQVPYHSSCITGSALLHPLFAGALLVLYLPLWYAKRKGFHVAAGYSFPERLLLFVPAFLLAWELGTYNYNYYLDHAFYFDRVLLLLLAIALLRFPGLAPFFIAATFVYRSQFNFPVAGFPLFDKRLLFDILVLFMAHRYLRLFLPGFKVPFLFLVLCIVASNYFASGFAKITISPHGYEWLAENRLTDLFANVRLRGWLAGSSEATIAGMQHFLSRFGIVFQGLILALELGAVFIFRGRKTAIVLFCCLALMHLGIFVFGSMLFWKWMAIDLCLAGIFIFSKSTADAVFAGKKNLLTAAVVVLFSFAWLQPYTIGWHDTPFNQYFTYEVVAADGKVYEMGKNDFNPYHQWIQYDQFLFLVDQPCLRISGFGYTNNYRLATAVKKAGPAGIPPLEAQKGENQFSAKQKEKYDAFFRRYFSNRNKRCGQSFFPSQLAAPDHLYNRARVNPYHDQSPVRLFRVIFNQAFTQNDKTIAVQKNIVDEISIPE